MRNWLVYKMVMERKHALGKMAEIAIDWYYDRKLGGIETGEWRLLSDHGLHCDGNRYQPTSYPKLKAMMDHLQLGPEDTFVDLGAGKGRVLFVVAMQCVRKVIGVEVNEELVEIARRNLTKLRFQKSPIEILRADAATFQAPEGTIFFMFNPFREQTVTSVIDNIKETFITNPRHIHIVYYSPLSRRILDNQDWLIPVGEIGKTGIFVWRSR